jgi:hypothetical protein
VQEQHLDAKDISKKLPARNPKSETGKSFDIILSMILVLKMFQFKRFT